MLYAARHDLLPVGAYFLGRGLELTERERTRVFHTVLATAAFVAAFGLIDVYAVPLSFWRHASGWFSDQLGLDYTGLSGLPENFVYNAGNGVVFRRLDLDVPLAARDVVPARRGAALRADSQALGPAARSAALRRAALDAHALALLALVVVLLVRARPASLACGRSPGRSSSR